MKLEKHLQKDLKENKLIVLFAMKKSESKLLFGHVSNATIPSILSVSKNGYKTLINQVTTRIMRIILLAAIP